MIKVIKFNQLGKFKNDWLSASYHFSFSAYYNPERMSFGKLRVINDDVIAPHSGFDTHSHRDMEIITYVKKGVITHQDSMGNVAKIVAGDIQVMSAGSGVFHSEHNLEDIETNLFQIWIEPRIKNITPRWENKQFPQVFNNQLQLLASGKNNDQNNTEILKINQEAAIYGAKIKAGLTINHQTSSPVYLLVAAGSIQLGDNLVNQGDGAEISNLTTIDIEAIEDSEILLIEA